MCVVLPAKGHILIGDVQEAVIGDGDAVGVAREVMQNMLGSAKRPLGVDDPVLAKQCTEESLECFCLRELLAASEELKLIAPKELLQPGNELAAEHAAEHSHGQEETLPRVNPAAMIWR